MAFAAQPQVPKNEQGYGLMTARRRAKLELMLERERARDATSKRLQAQHGRKAAYDDVVNFTVRVRPSWSWDSRAVHRVTRNLA